MSYFGLCLAVGAILSILWLAYVLLRHSFTNPRDYGIEQVDIIEGGCIIEQQRWGRERWRRAEVKIPSRPLSYEEELNLRSILDSGNGNVKIITSPPPDPDERVWR